MIRLALIGAGRTVRMAHAPALQSLHERYQVVALADQSPEALEEVGILLGVPPEHRYRNYHEMLLHEDVEVVDIALPHRYHYDAAMAALLGGAHLVTERPLALSHREAEELLTIAQSHGRLITVLHYYLYFPPFREGLRLVREGAIGHPFFMRCEGVTGGYGPGTEAYHPAWHNDPALSGGGVWMESGYHSLYLCRAMMDAPVYAITTHITTNTGEMQVDDTAAALVRHTGDAVSSIQVAWSIPSGGQRVIEVYGSEGTLAFGHEGHLLGIFSNASRTWHHPQLTFSHDASFIELFRALADCLQHGAPPPISHRDALQTLNIVLAGYQSAEDGRTVDVEE